MISFPCGNCNKQLKVKDELAGKKVKCPGCGQPVVVPALAAAPARQEERTVPPSVSAGTEERTLPPKNPGQVGKESLSDVEGQTALGADRKGQQTQALPAEGPSPQSYDFLAPAEKPDEIGRLGPYRVLKVLGAGGMGVVFRAEDPHLERMVALKAMLPSMASSSTAKERFFREAKAAAALKHPHIVTIFQVGEDRGAPFLAMEYLEGEPLDDRLKRETRLPVPEILRIGREIAKGLAAAHEKGLIHRDIKPANLWLEGKEGHVKILDFGLARAMGDTTHLTQSGAIIGTPAYMAPEQAGGKQVDSRCDLFSLGCVLYCMCTGERPFKGHDTISTLMAIATENPPPPVSLNLELPTELSDLVMQLLAKKADDRPESAKMVAETLQEIEGQTAETTAVPGRKAKTAEMTAAPARKTGKVKKGGTKQMEAARTQAGKSAKRRLPLPWLVGGGVLGLGVLAAAIILFWQTPYGTVRIESDDPNVEIVFDKDGPTIKGADKEPISLRAGEHGILIKRGDFAFEADKFVLKQGQNPQTGNGSLMATRPSRAGWQADCVPRHSTTTDRQGDCRCPAFDQEGRTAAKKDFTNSYGMKFVWIPPGNFMMGSPKDEKERRADETQHKVTLTKGFYMGVYTVTQEQWQEVMGKNPSHFKGEKNLPVDSVSWNDCQEFIKKLREKDKKPYRLPSEAEWEFACRAGTTTPFHFGETISTDQANYNGEIGKNGVFRQKTTPVGSFPANAFGLHDMHGNVWQWCQDWYGEYPQKDVVDPQGPEKGQIRVLRGGSWFDFPEICRSACRFWDEPGCRFDRFGLRVCFCLEEDRIPLPKKDPPKKDNAAVPPNPFTNSIGMKFVWITPGSFMMGSPKEEKERQADGTDETQHKVTLTKGFYMGVYAVTQEQWQEVMDKNPSEFKGENCPVEMVSWEDCQEFIKKLREKDKEAYRLPTEAEWEYACRAGTTTPFHFGETISTDQANFNGEIVYGKGKKGFCRKKTTPVDTFPANAWGLHDMHGNVFQWCQDWYSEYPENDVVDPQGPKKGEVRVLRGGSWDIHPDICRSACRSRNEPGHRFNALGFRLCFCVD